MPLLRNLCSKLSLAEHPRLIYPQHHAMKRDKSYSFSNLLTRMKISMTAIRRKAVHRDLVHILRQHDSMASLRREYRWITLEILSIDHSPGMDLAIHER